MNLLANRVPPTVTRRPLRPLHAQFGHSPLTSASPALDDLSFKFAMWAGRTALPCLDVGCGPGVAARAALARGARLIAVDPDPNCLRQLLTQLPVNQFGNISVHSVCLEDLTFPVGQLACVHISRVLHHLGGTTIQRGFADIARWLQPGGKLFLSAFTPEGRYWKDFNAELSRREKLGDRWPGYIDDVSRYDSRSPAGMACHLLSAAVLMRELQKVGFEIEESMTYTLAWDSAQTCCALVARLPHNLQAREYTAGTLRA